MLRCCMLFLTAALLTHTCVAQTVLPTGQQQKWSPDFGRVKVADKEMVLYVAFDKKTKGLVRIDDKGAEKWSTPLDTKNQVIGIAKLNGNVLAITANDESKKSYANIITKLNAMVVDPATGKVLQEKTIIQLPGNYVEPTVFVDEDFNLTAIVVRHSKWNGEASVFTLEKMETEKAQTPRLEVYTVSNDLTATVKHSYSFADDLRHESMHFNKNGELTVFSFNSSNQTFVVEQFANGAKKGIASTPFEVPVKSVYDFLTVRSYVNPANSNEVYSVMSYDRKRKDRYVKFCQFDLARSTAKVHQIEVNGAYREELEKNAVLPPSEKAVIEKRRSEYITALNIEIYNGKPVVITEFGADYDAPGGSGSGSFIKSDGIITVYNPDLTVNKQFLFPKFVRSKVGSFGDGVAHRIDGNKLRLLADNQLGAGADHAILYGEIDLDQMKWIKYQGAKKDGRQSLGDPLVTYATIWWPAHMLVTRRETTLSDKIKDFEKIIPVSYE